MNINDRFLRGCLLGLAGGGLAGYLLASYLNRSRYEAELARVRDQYRAKEARARRDAVFSAFDVVPTHRFSVSGDPSRGASDGGDHGREDPHVAGDQSFELRELRDTDTSLDDYQSPLDVEYAPDADDPLFGLSDSDYEPGAATSLGVDGNGNPVDEEFPDEADGSEDDSDDQDRSSTPEDRRKLDSRGPGPFIITESEFSEECLDYQKLTIMYYRASDTLADDKQEPIPGIRETIGLGTTDQFGKDPDNPNILYVRNNKLEIDFEVCLDYGSYTERVLGYGTASPKPPRVVNGKGLRACPWTRRTLTGFTR
jgi:hypothetical protein